MKKNINNKSAALNSQDKPSNNDSATTPEYKAHGQVSELQKIIDAKSQVIDQQKQRIDLLEEMLRLQTHKRFGKSSEKNPNQGELFNEAELEADNPESQEPDDDQDAQESPKNKKRNPVRKLSDQLPRKQIFIYLSDEEKEGAIDIFFVSVKEELDIIPAKVQVLEYMQEKAVFVDDQGKRTIVEAKRDKHPLGKAIASTSLLAYLIVAKYCDGLPLYRMEGILKRYGGSVTRTTMATWMIRIAEELQVLINLLQEVQLKADSLQGDESRIQVLKEQGLSPQSHKWMWVLRGGPPGKPVVLFEYDKSRGKSVAKRLLEDFEGRYFQSDGYAGYDEPCKSKNIIHLGCWDHARRKFNDAIAAEPKAKAKQSAPSKARMALSMINKLYRIEREIKELSTQEKYTQRQEQSIVQLEKLQDWLIKNQQKIAKGSLTRKAVDYTLNQWEKLTRYCEHGDLHISNILAENAIRPFAVGRNAWLFADTPKGARASATLYSLIESAKANNLEPSRAL